MGLAQLLFIILLFSPLTAIAQKAKTELCLENQRTLLLEMRKQLVFNSSLSTRLVLWNDADDCCGWEGVECDGGGRVISLLLGYEGISGGLDESSSLFGLEYLEELDLSNNVLNGSQIPREFHKLMHLTSMDLSFCSLIGHFPEIIFHLPSLQVLDLSYNPLLQGSIPQFSRNNSFQSIVLSRTSFSGSLPDSISSLKSLSGLYLSNCNFSGSIPSTLSNLTRLVTLDLSNNFFTGSISSIHFQPHSNISNIYSLFNLQNLDSLSLSENRFSDTIELEKILLSLPKLKYLDLSSNNLSLDDSTTTSPAAAAAQQSSLSYLDLSNNKIQGEIPSWICLIIGSTDQLGFELPSSLRRGARHADSSNNRRCGSFPTDICSTTTILQVLDLSSNNLSGRIPDCLFEKAESLLVLNLGRNKISGHIPDKFSVYSSLTSLDLSDNNLVGDVPLSLANPSNLEILNLSGNKLSGTIPPNLKKLKVLNLGRNSMTGPISLANFTADCPLRYLVLNNNNFTGEVPISLANCKQLAVMNVGNNQIEGSFPCMLPSSLQVLVLRSNRFHGEVTCRKNQSWPNLQIIDIASNQFRGYLNTLNFSTWRGMMRDTVTKLSHETLGFSAYYRWDSAYYKEEVTLTIKGVERKLVKIKPDFTSMDFSNNSFHGSIPDSISGLDALYLLNLSHNGLTGTIPKSFGNLVQLESLDLSVNRLAGEILFCRSFRYKYFDKIEDVCDKIFGFCQHRKKKHRGRRVSRK